MKQGRALPELVTELKRQANAKRDLLAPAKAIRVHSNGCSRLVLDDSYVVNDIAHGQLAEYAGVPKPFYDRLRSATNALRVPLLHEDYDPSQADYPLFDVLVNTLLEKKGEDRRLVRTLDGTARAFLSENFNTDLDNYDVLRVAAKAMDEMGLTPENVVSCEVTERKLYVKVVSPKLEATIEPSNLHREHGGFHFLKEPQVVRAGFLLSNSETGLGSLRIQQTIYRLQCTNLWIKEEAYRQRHLGRALEADESGEVYKSDTRLADARAKLLKIRDHVEAALDEHRFLSLVGKMQETTQVRLEGSVEKITEATARKFGLSGEEKDAVLRNLIEGADLSLWGLSNAITATAQTAESYDRATDLEAIGGRLFDLAGAEVAELVRAA